MVSWSIPFEAKRPEEGLRVTPAGQLSKSKRELLGSRGGQAKPPAQANGLYHHSRAFENTHRSAAEWMAGFIPKKRSGWFTKKPKQLASLEKTIRLVQEAPSNSLSKPFKNYLLLEATTNYETRMGKTTRKH